MLQSLATPIGPQVGRIRFNGLELGFDAELRDAKVDLAKTFDDRFIKKAAGM